MEARWNSYVEVPKRINFKVLLKKACIEMGLKCEISSDDVHRDALDKFLGISKEVVYFDITGEYSKLVILKSRLERAADEWNKAHNAI